MRLKPYSDFAGWRTTRCGQSNSGFETAELTFGTAQRAGRVIKRQIFGRARFDLFRKRVLLAN
jgi:hypothetical protein